MTKPVCITCGQIIDDGVEVIPPTKRRGPGHPPIFNMDIANEICKRVAQGEPITKILKDEHMPDYSTVMAWRRGENGADLRFIQMYAQAREEQADWLADQMLEVAHRTAEDWLQDPVTGRWEPQHLIVQRCKLILEQMRWNASKLKPREYGDRIDARLTGVLATATITETIDASSIPAGDRDALRALLLPLLTKRKSEDESEG